MAEQDDLIAELREHGARRLAARDADRKEVEAIARLLPAAIEAGIATGEADGR